MCVGVLLDTDSWAPVSPKTRELAVRQHDAVATLLAAAGWRLLPITHGSTLAPVWPLAGGRLATAGAPR